MDPKTKRTFANVIDGTRDIPLKLEVSTSLPKIQIKVSDKKKIRVEKPAINQAVRNTIRDKLKINAPFSISLISSDENSTECHDDQFTNEIEYIMVLFNGADNPVIQDLVGRVETLETKVKNLQEKDWRLKIRVLLEMGRNHMWEQHKAAYMECDEVKANRKEFIHEKKYYNSDKLIFQKPDSWEHFIGFVKSVESSPDIVPLLNHIDGGYLSNYAALSDEAHEGSEEEIVDAIVNLNLTIEKLLFELVYKKSFPE